MHLPPVLEEEILALIEPIDPKRAARFSPTRGELDLLRERITAAQQLNPDRADFHHALGAIYFAKGWLVSGERELQAAAERDHNNPHVFYNLGVLYYEGHWQRHAGVAWNTALNLDSTLADAHHNLAYLYYSWKEYDAAWQHCEKALAYGAKVSPELVSDILENLRKRGKIRRSHTIPCRQKIARTRTSRERGAL
jgi:tetratricopeptide (TPR) repeat protein